MEDKVKEVIESIKQKTDNLLNLNLISKLIKDNKIEFDYKDIKYRVKKPNFEQKQEASIKRQNKYIELLKDLQFVREIDLIKIYESRGINILEWDKKLDQIKIQIEEYSEKLGKALAENSPDSDLEILKQEIEKLFEEQNDILLKKSIYLEASLESQVNVFSYTYLAYLTTEKFVEGSWIKAWNSYDQFIKEDEELVNQITWYSTFVSKGDLPAA